MEQPHESSKKSGNPPKRKTKTVSKKDVDGDDDVNAEKGINGRKGKQPIKRTNKKATESGKATRSKKNKTTKTVKLKTKTLNQEQESKVINVKETVSHSDQHVSKSTSENENEKGCISSCNENRNDEIQKTKKTVFTQTCEQPICLSTGSDPINLCYQNCVDVSTSTNELFDDRENDMISKVIRVETRKDCKYDKLPLIVNESMMPSTPEGPRFSQDGTQLTYTHPGVQMEVIQKLYIFQTQGFICDVVMRVEGVDFKAHKIVLAASSPYFSELFRKMNTVRTDRLILQGLKPQSVAAMLGYFYMAKLIIDVEDIEELLDAAYYFKVKNIFKYLILFDIIRSKT